MAGAFAKRRDPDGSWTVYDIETEQVIVIDGLPLAGLGEDEAEEAASRLGNGEIAPDNDEVRDTGLSPSGPAG
jgi:hypothetical protein